MNDPHGDPLTDLKIRFFALQERVEKLEAQMAESGNGQASNRAPGWPTLKTVLAYAQVIGCLEEEAKAFFLHFDAVGWVDKNGNAITNWQSKLGSWMAQKRSQANSPTQMVNLQKELELVGQQMSDIRGSYSDNQSWTHQDIAQWRKLKERRDEIRKALGWQKT